MPALPPVTDVVRVDMAHTWDEDPHLTNRFYIDFTGGAPSEATMNQFATDVVNSWVSNLAPLCNELIHLVSVVTTDLTSDTANRGEQTVSHAGTRSGQNLTINDCAVMNFQIARRYRGGKPRLYGPWGVAGDLADSNTWGGSFITACEDAWTAFMAALVVDHAGTSFEVQQNVSYYSGFASVQNPVTKRWSNIPTPRTEAVHDDIISVSLSKYIGSQRRRVRA